MKPLLASTLATTMSALAFVLIAAPAGAQTAATGATTERPRMQHRDDRAFSRPTERVEARLAYVRTALKITSAQESQWNAYAEKMRQLAGEREKTTQEMRGQMQRGQGIRPTVIERMEMRQKFHADAIRRMNDVLAVQKPLYEALSAEQKRDAEVVMSPRGPGGRGEMRGGRGAHHEGGQQHGRHHDRKAGDGRGHGSRDAA